MEKSNLLFTISGIRGIVGKDMTKQVARKIAIAFGTWLSDKRVIIGRDTRPSGEELKEGVIEGLLIANCQIIDLGICPTPAIIYKKNQLEVSGGIIISGSHNPPEWNALKLIGKDTFIDQEELKQILDILKRIKSQSCPNILQAQSVQKMDAIDDYMKALYSKFNLDKLNKQNNLRVVVDTGAGAGKFVTPEILARLGCEVIIINNELDENNKFPREIEPIDENLKDLVMAIWEGKYDIGFAHDCDADRLAIIGDDFKWYPEDVGLAIIAHHELIKAAKQGKDAIFVTNLASSLMFDVLAERFNAQIIRTPIGERFLAEKMNKLLLNIDSESTIVFGGEGSCGGIMDPYFNNARDGIYAAAKIIEILVETGEKISNLVSKLPQFYTYREKIEYPKGKISPIITKVKDELMNEGEKVSQIDNDLRIKHGYEWFILIHPSNTEPMIRVITEAKRESLARVYCETTANLVRLVISKL
jgi:phosphomannomutase